MFLLPYEIALIVCGVLVAVGGVVLGLTFMGIVPAPVAQSFKVTSITDDDGNSTNTNYQGKFVLINPSTINFSSPINGLEVLWQRNNGSDVYFALAKTAADGWRLYSVGLSGTPTLTSAQSVSPYTSPLTYKGSWLDNSKNEHSMSVEAWSKDASSV